ncbi:MAG TPA: SDR family oxidoreductase [Solirubrobacteraceae bacterium]|nr:SDR family oxidoreductase [Solirubrobacteraceae bacterium]
MSYLDELFGLRGATAVITGATSGLGAASALALGRAGAAVVAVGRSRERGEEVVSEIEAAGAAAELELADVSDPAQAEELADRVLDRHERIDILVNAAGVFARDDALDTSLKEWQRLMATNVTSTFLLCQRFGRPMIERGYGKIVNFSSTDGFLGVPEQVAYNVSKGAIVQLTRTLGSEWIRHGVNVNAVAPCDFATPMIAPFLDTQEYREWILDAIPAGRVGQPEEIIGAVLFLCSRASSMVAGHNLLVDGGRTVI